MKKFISTILILLLSTVQSQAIAEEKDPYTVYVQEQLTSLGYLDTELTGVNDSATFKAIQEFQEKANLKIDGLAGPNTFAALLGGESSFINNNDKTAPSWSDDPITTNQRNKTFNVFWGVVNDDSGISHFNIYVNGVLADSELLENGRYRVTNFQCAEKITVTVEAVDIYGNSSFSPNKSIFTKFCELVSPIYMADTNMFLISFDTSSSSRADIVETEVDSSGNIYIIGNFSDTINVLGTSLTSSGGQDIFIIKLDANGNLLFAKRFGGTATVYSRDLVVDSSGNIYFVGLYTGGNFTIDGFSAGETDSNSTMVFAIKLNSSGNRAFSMFGGGTGYNYYTGVALANDENSIYITGGSNNQFTTGSNSKTIGSGSYNFKAFLLQMFTSDGSIGSNIITGGSNCICIAEKVVVGSSSLYVTGVHAGTLDLTSDIGESFASNGNYDTFIWKDLVPTAAISFGGTGTDFPYDLDIGLDSESNERLYLSLNYESGFNLSNGLSALTSNNENAVLKIATDLTMLSSYEIQESTNSTVSKAIISSGDVFVSYGNSAGSNLIKLDSDLQFIDETQFLSSSQSFLSPTTDPGMFHTESLAVNSSGELFLASSIFDRLLLMADEKEIIKSGNNLNDLFLLKLDNDLNY